MFTLKTSIGILLLCFFTVSVPKVVSAQKNKKELPKDKVVKYSLSENSRKAHHLYVAFTPFYVEVSTFTGAIGNMVDVNYSFKNIVGFYGRYQNSIFHDDQFVSSTISTGPDGGGISAPISQRFRNLEYGSTNYFKRSSAIYDAKIIVLTEQQGLDKVRYYIVVPTTLVKLWGFRGGLQSLRTTVEAARNNFGFETVIDNEKILLDGGYYSTMMGMNAINIGASFTRVIDADLDIEGLGKKKLRGRSEVYADVLYAPAIVFADMAVKLPNKDVIIADVNELSARSRLGARVGGAIYPGSVLGFGIGGEAGIRPGPAYRSIKKLAYFDIKVSINLAARL